MFFFFFENDPNNDNGLYSTIFEEKESAVILCGTAASNIGTLLSKNLTKEKIIVVDDEKPSYDCSFYSVSQPTDLFEPVQLSDDLIDRITSQSLKFVFLVAALGGGIGSCYSKAIAEILRQVGVLTFTYAIMPFDHEQEEKRIHADFSMIQLRDFSSTVVPIMNQKIIDGFNGTKSVAKIFDELNKDIAKNILYTISMFESERITTLSYTDIRSIMGGSFYGYIATGTADIKDASTIKTALAEAFASPYLEINTHNCSDAILAFISGCDISLQFVSTAINQFKKRTSSSTNVLYSVALDKNLGDVVKIVAILRGENLYKYDPIPLARIAEFQVKQHMSSKKNTHDFIEKTNDGNYIFVSYAHKDLDRVEPFLAALSKRYNIWYDENLHPGEQYFNEIAGRIKKAAAFIYIVTQNSLDSSFCRKEIHYASERVHKPFVNVVLENVEYPDWFELGYMEYQLLDISMYKDMTKAVNYLDSRTRILENCKK